MVTTRSRTMGTHVASKEKTSKMSYSSNKKKRKINNVDEGTPKHALGKQKSSKRKMNYVGKEILFVEKSNKKKKKRKRNNLHIGKTKENTSSIIQVGDTVNLSDLLFTNYRDYLVTYDQNNRRVKANDLAGKVVVLHFMSLTNYIDTWRAPVVNLRDIYSQLHPKYNYDIVFVALREYDDDFDNGSLPLMGSNTRECFREIVSMMPPCPAIPLSDRKSIKRLERVFGVGEENWDENLETPLGPESFIIDPRGVVLQSYATPLLLRYGAAGYPFTGERIQFLDSEDNFVRMQPFSVEKYLASPERDYLIDNKGEQVPLHNLDDKVVGLYFCPCLDGLRTTRELEIVYQELSKNKENFEIVLIDTHGWCEHEDTCAFVDEDSFLDEIKTMPWLALPFTDTDCNKKLQRIFQNPQDL